MLTSRKQRPLERDETTLRDATLIVIATEGAKTEVGYFSRFGGSRLKVRVIPAVDNRSSPKDILQNILNFQTEYDLDQDDQLWVVIDRDRWKLDQLKHVARECHAKSIDLAVSNPCFELWLALHLDQELPEMDPGVEAHHNAKLLETFLRDTLGSYNKANPDIDKFADGLDRAIVAAKALDIAPADRWPNTIATRVYRLMEKIQQLSR
ncbi:MULTISPECIES: RloB family protein [unclassified Brevundimonas]|uniref:RloB family protein n=1 Tax=unclassified Brevundimonas TaxID=2622653 RepID=UPI0025C13C9A|nr:MULTISPECIES: RloB family protein [unclassified Brevundimonas]